MLLVLTQSAPVDLEVVELVVVLLAEQTQRNATITIKVSQTMMLLSHSQTTMKPASISYKLKSPIEKKLPITCLLFIVIAEQYMRSEKIQMLLIRSIALYVEGNIALRTALP